MQTHQQLERNTVDSNSTIERMQTTLDSPQTKLVYLYLTTVESGTVEQVREALDVKLISLYPVLNTLVEKGLIERDGPHYVCSND